jgi:PAS domain S-box-containing protein
MTWDASSIRTLHGALTRLLAVVVVAAAGAAAAGWTLGARASPPPLAIAALAAAIVAFGAAVAAVLRHASRLDRIDTARLEASRALRAHQVWLRAVLASIGDGVVAADREGRITYLNAVAERLTGVGERDALGRLVAEVLRPAAAVGEASLGRALAEGLRGPAPFQLAMAAAGGELPVEGIAGPLADGGAPGVVLAFRDMAERRAAEAERARLLASERAARAEVERASRAKDEFIATVSHELRTPLNAVLGWARLLRMGKLDPASIARAVESIERSATTQAQIVDDLLDIARIARGQLKLDVRPVELVPVVEAAIDAVRPASQARDIEIAAVLEPGVGPVAGDPGRLQQVAWNLLSNAIKFTPAGGRVEVRLRQEQEQAALSVKDTGAGIPAEFIPRVFERFSQADSSSTRAHGGLGLGLAIVRHLVEAHGGTVSVESTGPGHGSTFTMRLPISRPTARRVARAAPPADDAALPLPERPLASLRSLRILVVDDDPDTLEVVREVLERAGALVTTVSSAPEAIEALAAAPPDVLLSDIGMPGEDGFSLIRRVRRLAPSSGGEVPAAALTAYTQAEDRRQALLAGYQLYLPKPIEPSELTAAIARLAGRAT